mmetsp:Transcript_28477/g.75299  ORF Transcript_28477/g.75299 Transcript_28477/m.75299 type:complete len:214 (+) Transcript_28477:190-831(+)
MTEPASVAAAVITEPAPVSALCPCCGLCTTQTHCERCGAPMLEALEVWRSAGVCPETQSSSTYQPGMPPENINGDWAALRRGMASLAELSTGLVATEASGTAGVHMTTTQETTREGLAEKVLSLLSVRKIERDPEDESECQVCLVAFCAGDELLILPCSHSYHRACIVRWLQAQTTCPLCKYDMGWLSAASQRTTLTARPAGNGDAASQSPHP